MEFRIIVPHLNDYDQFLIFMEKHQDIQKSYRDVLRFEIWDGGSSAKVQEDIRAHCQKLSWEFHFFSKKESLVKVLKKATETVESRRVMILPVDCLLSENLVRELLTCDKKWLWGGFPKEYPDSQLYFKIYLALLNKILGATGRLVWTNGIFIDSQLARAVSWKNENLLVDWYLSQTLRKEFPFYFGKNKILVSHRKYLKNGVLRQMLTNGLIVLLVSLGFGNESFLKRLYK